MLVTRSQALGRCHPCGSEPIRRMGAGTPAFGAHLMHSQRTPANRGGTPWTPDPDTRARRSSGDAVTLESPSWRSEGRKR